MTVALPAERILTPEVAHAVWAELRGPRAATHRHHRVNSCDTELQLAGLRLTARGARPAAAGYRLTGHCPCRDLVADALESTWTFLANHGPRLANPAGAVRKDLRFRLVDRDRTARRDRGAPVKPKTVRENRYGRALPDDFHREVLVMIADEAGASGPLRGVEGLLTRLSERCADRFGEPATAYAQRLPEVLGTIERVCRCGPRVNVGTTGRPELTSWWEAYVERPLGRRPDPADAPGAPEVAAGTFDRALDAADDEAVLSVLRTQVGARPRPHRELALALAIDVLACRGLLPRLCARRLLADHGRRREVLDHLEELVRGEQ